MTRFRSARLFPPQQTGGVTVVIASVQPPLMLPESTEGDAEMEHTGNLAYAVNQAREEYKRTGKVTTRLAPNVTRVLDQETVNALEQINQGNQISADQVKSIGNKTRKLTQRLDDILP